ncbi:MAG: lipocalin family protein [Bacteroidales bacterium]|nr:lipocalin family protein [Bacteroidales bacterium]
MNKKLLFSLIALFMLSFVFSSCKKDDNNDNNYSKEIVGKWLMTHYVLYVDGVKETDFTPTTEDEEDDNYEVEYAVFTSDGKYSAIVNGRPQESGKWSINGDKLTIVYSEEDDDAKEVYTISIVENTLTMSEEFVRKYDNKKIKDIITYVKQ